MKGKKKRIEKKKVKEKRKRGNNFRADEKRTNLFKDQGRRKKKKSREKNKRLMLDGWHKMSSRLR